MLVKKRFVLLITDITKNASVVPFPVTYKWINVQTFVMLDVSVFFY